MENPLLITPEMLKIGSSNSDIIFSSKIEISYPKKPQTKKIIRKYVTYKGDKKVFFREGTNLHGNFFQGLYFSNYKCGSIFFHANLKVGLYFPCKFKSGSLFSFPCKVVPFRFSILLYLVIIAEILKSSFLTK